MRRSTVLFAFGLALSGCGDNITVPPDRDPAADPDPTPLSCVPNLDDQIDRCELAPAIGTTIRYVVSAPDETRKVDLAGTLDEDGETHWDFATDFATDQTLSIVPTTLEGKWYQASFDPDAFVTPFDRSGKLDSIGLLTQDSLQLLGLASSEEDPKEGKTLLVYDPPIVVLQFPVEVGQSFVSTGEIVNGLIQGLPYAGQDTYEVSVDAEGSIDLLQLTFEQVHRVRTKVTTQPAVGETQITYQTSFYAECFAEVARATSAPGETSPDFTEAGELRRLGY